MVTNGTSSTKPLYVGLDLGTTGVRAVAIDEAGRVDASHSAPLPPPRRRGPGVEQAPAIWWEAVVATLQGLSSQLTGIPAALAVDGTSGTILLVDEALEPYGPALLYNDARARREADLLATKAAPTSGAIGPTSSLAKLMWMTRQGWTRQATAALHQADWIASKLCARVCPTDYNNALKLGYDPVSLAWPAWLDGFDLPRDLFPNVVAPGTPLGVLSPELARRLRLPSSLRIVAGTTDSTACFLAAGPSTPGEAVTSLGSTLVLKLLATKPLYDAAHGVYSHRLGDRWLVGGGSNTGGAVLLQHFDAAEIEALSAQIDPAKPTGLDYYPLLAPGERFPICDPELKPVLTPVPAERAVFLQGMLEGIAAIEQRGYALLQELGAPPVARVFTSGGGAENPAWRQLRARRLGVDVLKAEHTDAAYGAALIARGYVQQACNAHPTTADAVGNLRQP